MSERKREFTDEECSNVADNVLILLLITPLFLALLLAGLVFVVLVAVYGNPDFWSLALGLGLPGVLLTGFSMYIIHGTIGLRTLWEAIWHWVGQRIKRR